MFTCIINHPVLFVVVYMFLYWWSFLFVPLHSRFSLSPIAELYYATSNIFWLTFCLHYILRNLLYLLKYKKGSAVSLFANQHLYIYIYIKIMNFWAQCFTTNYRFCGDKNHTFQSIASVPYFFLYFSQFLLKSNQSRNR